MKDTENFITDSALPQANRSCTQEERKQHLYSTYPSPPDTNSFINSLNDSELPRYGMLVDEKHKVLACLHFKVGSSTWRLIFANNSAKVPIPSNKLATIFKKLWFFNDYDIHLLYESRYDAKAVRDIFKTYYKFMVVRHPLTRLVSTFHDKFNRKHFWFANLYGKDILKKYRPNAKKSAQNKGFGVTFEELMKFIRDGGQDGHWEGPYEKLCQPCSIDYDYIVKLETHDQDASYIVNKKLSGRGISTKGNSRRDPAKSFTETLPEYNTLDPQLFQVTVDHYHRDLEQFGYEFVQEKGTVKASCGQKSHRLGNRCC